MMDWLVPIYFLLTILLAFGYNFMYHHFQKKISYLMRENGKQWNVLFDITSDDKDKSEAVHKRMMER